MHSWGDEWKHWNDLYAAESFIVKYVKKHSGCVLICKEKYGTIRYEHVLPPFVRIFSKNKLQWYWSNSWLARKLGLYGWKVVIRAIKKAIKKWPSVTKELIDDAWFFNDAYFWILKCKQVHNITVRSRIYYGNSNNYIFRITKK